MLRAANSLPSTWCARSRMSVPARKRCKAAYASKGKVSQWAGCRNLPPSIIYLRSTPGLDRSPARRCRARDDGAFVIQPDKLNLAEIRNASGNAEMPAILNMANQILRLPRLPERFRLGIVTDSE